jgi:DNA polymerase-4
VGLTASGISVNKFVAKIASDFNKPNGQNGASRWSALILEELPIRKFYGVGKVTTEKMYQLGIFTGVELKSKS